MTGKRPRKSRIRGAGLGRIKTGGRIKREKEKDHGGWRGWSHGTEHGFEFLDKFPLPGAALPT